MRSIVHPRSPPKRSQGAALLLAMLIVTLVASVAASGLWLQWQSVAVERHERLRQQLSWLMVGAFDWSRLILNEDRKDDSRKNRMVDDLTEPWATPLQEVRLSTFLSRDKVIRDGDPEVVLSGQVQDAQSKINLNGLLDAQQHTDQAQMWVRLFQLLALPMNEWNTLRSLAEIERLARSGKSLPPALQARRVLWPARPSDFGTLGLSPPTLDRLQAFVTVLPDHTTINVNTASAEVLYASLDGTDWAQAQNLVGKRASAPWASLSDLQKAMGRSTPLNEKRLGVRTDFFLLTGQLRIEELRLQERALVSRKTTPPSLVWRAQTEPSTKPSAIRMPSPSPL